MIPVSGESKQHGAGVLMRVHLLHLTVVEKWKENQSCAEGVKVTTPSGNHLRLNHSHKTGINPFMRAPPS
jgi:hypothetical protein